MKKKAIIEKPPRNSANHWLDEIMRETVGSNDDPVPEGWMTQAEMARQAGVVHQTMQNRIDKLLHSGRLQRKKFKILVGNRRSPVWHYYPKA